MIFYRIALGMVVYVLSVIWGIASEPRLEICFFDTGQGNCIALRSDVVSQNGVESKLIFIDCGQGKNTDCKEKLSNLSEYPGKKLESLFNGVFVCDVFVTYNHKDHDNLVKTIARIGEEKGCSVLDPIRPMSMETFCKSKPEDLKDDWDDFCVISSPRIKNSLGSHVRVVPIRPERWGEIDKPPHEHDFNMMYLVEFAGRRILFMGDINPQLFIQIIGDPKYEREIRAVDFLVVSHHGSNQSGELMTKGVINPELYIICSDPRGPDNLPWREVVDFQFKNGKGITTKKHVVSRRKKRDRHVSSAYRAKNRSESVETQEETLPVFVTCDAAQGYYELVIAVDGTAMLFDGPTAGQTMDFYFQSL
jgi:hypothetical protein